MRERNDRKELASTKSIKSRLEWKKNAKKDKRIRPVARWKSVKSIEGKK